MPYIFSTSQIDRCHHLLTEHNFDVNQIADIMNTSIRNANHLIRLVKQKFTDKYVRPLPSRKYIDKEVIGKKYTYDAKTDDLLKRELKTFTRPPAEYSNKKYFW